MAEPDAGVDDRRPNRHRLAWGLSAAATIAWLIVVSLAGLWPRVVDQWASAVTMLFGSFLAGSSPEGGGAVAFPVFTKALDVDPPIARTFGLSIQAVGMTMAALAIWLNGREVRARAVVSGSIAGTLGLLAGAFVLGRPDVAQWPPSISSAAVKATFSIVLATTSVLMLRQKDDGPAGGELRWTRRVDLGVVVAAFAGGILSSFTGTGANVLVFLFLVVLIGVRPRIALPTAIVVMAVVSIVGFVLYGVVAGQLGAPSADGRSDLLGLWLAAVPVVVWGAPVGSLVASLVPDSVLVRFVAILAAVEVATTFLLVPELRTEPTLVVYFVAGLVLFPTRSSSGSVGGRRSSRVVDLALAQRGRGSVSGVRYLGFLHDGQPTIGVVTADSSAVTPLTAIDDFYGDLTRWRTATAAGNTVPLTEVEQIPAVPTTAKVLCLGLNYQAHVEETGRDRPPAPNIFARWYAGLSCDGDSISVPSGEPGLDWECELAVIIGDTLVDTPRHAAMAGILGYTCFNDISARTHQRATSQWALGKNPDGSGPIGPVVVTADEFGDPYGRSISTRVNGETKQSSTTDRMLFKIDETIEYITKCTSLRPGDVIATGTPEGVGGAMDPPQFMHAGDTVEVDIEGIGVLTTNIV